MTVIKGRKARSRRWPVCAVLAAALVYAAPDAEAQSASPPAEAIPSIGELIRAFETVVFGTEFQEFDNLTGRRQLGIEVGQCRIGHLVAGNEIDDEVGRVTDRFGIFGRQSGQGGERVQVCFDAANLLIGNRNLFYDRPLTAVGNINEAVAKAPDDDAERCLPFPHPAARMASQGGCYFASWPRKENGRLYRAVIVVNAELGDSKIGHCLLDEMTQALGLPNDVRVRWPSIFSEGKKVTDLSVYDRLFLQTLYDPRIKAGMSKTEGLRSARRILAERVRSTN